MIMATYIALLQYTDQGIRNVKETTKRATAAKEAAAKLGVKFTDFFWTLGHYDLVILAEAPDDETMTAVTLKLASLGNVKSQTLRAFRSNEMETIMKKAARVPKNRISTKKPYAHSRRHALHPERMEITEPRVVPRFVP